MPAPWEKDAVVHDTPADAPPEATANADAPWAADEQARGYGEYGSGGAEDQGQFHDPNDNGTEASRTADGRLLVDIHGDADPYEVAGTPDSTGAAAARGTMDTISFGGANRLFAGLEGLDSALHGESFTDTYDSRLKQFQDVMHADEAGHPVARITGQLLGGLVIPAGLEGVGLRAGTSALRMGATMREARAAAAVAVRNRMALMGGAGGATHGYLSSDDLGSADAAENAAVEGLAGSAGGVALGQAGAALEPGRDAARVARRALPLSDTQKVAAAAERQGIDILPADVGSEGVGRATQGARQSTFGSSVVARAADRRYDTFRDRVAELSGDPGATLADAGELAGAQAERAAGRSASAAEHLSGAIERSTGEPTDMTAGGQLVQRGVARLMDETAQRASQLYEEVPIEAARPGLLANTRRTLGEITADWASNPKLGAAFQHSKLARYLDALTPETVEQPGRVLPGGGRAQPTLGEQGGGLSWQDMMEFRTRVGDMLADPHLSEKIAPRQLRALYGSLTSDMEATAKAAGPEAFAKWKRANNFYDGRMKRINDTLSLVVGERKDMTPNEAMSSLQSMLREGSTGNAAAFERIMRSIPAEDAATVRATIVNAQRGGREFDPSAFAKAWGGLSERGKAALLPQSGARSLMNDAAVRADLAAKNPFAGKSGEQIFTALEKMAGERGDSVKFRATMASLSPEEANTVRAAFINQGGLAKAGAQNAAGDSFSVSNWLTRWNTLSDESKTTLFGHGELRAAMNDLALVADRMKTTEGLAGHSNTGAINNFNATTGGLGGAVIALLTGHPVVAAGLASPAAYQKISAHVLTSPRFVRWLARAPKTQLSTPAYLDRLTRIARAEPAIANDVLQLQSRLSEMLGSAPQRAAADNKRDKQ